MGVWVGKPALDGSETLVWQQSANRTQSANRAVGGRLYLTTARLLFEPNRVDAATGGSRWSVPLTAIVSVDVAPRDGRLFNGGLRNRLRIGLADGSAELFVVNRLDEVLRVISQAAQSR